MTVAATPFSAALPSGAVANASSGGRAVRRALPDDLAALVGDLRSPDPAVRDDGAYNALANRVAGGRVDEHLAALGDAGASLLADGEVQARSFGALLLALVVDRHNTLTSGIPKAGGAADDVRPLDVVRWLTDFLTWYSSEQDIRGHDKTLGWLHAVAHGADTLEAFSSSPLLNAADQLMLLDLAAERLHAPTEHHLTQQEDDRLGHAVMTILLHGAVPTADVLAWIDRLAAPWRARVPGAASAQLDNTIRFARTLHLLLTLGVRPEPDAAVRTVPDRDELLSHLGTALAEVAWFYGRPT